MATLIPEAMRAEISRNYIASEREARFVPFHAGAFLALVLVSLGAVLVDYMIVSEFWTRALANEFLELPGTLASSVAFKSMQVLFATIAAHILYEHMGRFGRGFFVRVVFALALVMLLGVGVLLAAMSLPNGLAATGAGGAVTALDQTLAGLGLATPGAAESVPVAGELDRLRAWQPLLWLASLGIVFLVVTGVAALCIHFATEALRRIFQARDFGQRHRDIARLAALEAEYDALRHRLSEMEGADNRRHLLWTGLMRECRAYEQGLDEARRALAVPAPASRRLIGGRRDETPPVQATERLRACDVSRDVARYERLFDEWWERRSRHAMKAGPARLETVREPVGEILPPVRGPRRIPIEKAAE